MAWRCLLHRVLLYVGAQTRSGLVTAAESLLGVAELAEGLSGRALRKLPFQAHAFFVQVGAAGGGIAALHVDLEAWTNFMVLLMVKPFDT